MSNYQREDVLRQAHAAETLADEIADIIHDAGSSDGTIAGIADPDSRAEAETQIARAKRDQARNFRQRSEYLAAYRAELKAKEDAAKMEDRREEQRRQGDGERISPQQVFKRFNRKATTG